MYFGMERKKQKRKNATPILRPGSEVSSGRTGGMHFNRKPERYALHITFCSLVFVLFFSFPSLFLSFFFFAAFAVTLYLFAKNINPQCSMVGIYLQVSETLRLEFSGSFFSPFSSYFLKFALKIIYIYIFIYTYNLLCRFILFRFVSQLRQLT